MQRTRINWPWQPLYTYNPVTGCRRGCTWGKGGCYARRNWNRLHRKRTGLEFPDVHFWPDRLLDKFPRKRSYIFVGSMSGIEYWESQWIEFVLRKFEKDLWHTGLFLTKDPSVYRFHIWPSNTMQGLTLTCEDDSKVRQSKALLDIDCAPRPFLSIEPLLGCLRVNVPPIIDRVIVGEMTGPGAVKVRPEWVQSIKENVPAEKIYWKQPWIAA